MWVYVVVALTIVVMAFGIGQLVSGLGMAFYGARLNPAGRLFSRSAAKA